jgi:hypothetical protein
MMAARLSPGAISESSSRYLPVSEASYVANPVMFPLEMSTQKCLYNRMLLINVGIRVTMGVTNRFLPRAVTRCFSSLDNRAHGGRRDTAAHISASTSRYGASRPGAERWAPHSAGVRPAFKVLTSPPSAVGP